jgi:DNA-binding beta-propeller fold protein YncE
MGDNEVLVVSLADGATVARIAHVATVRGVAIADSLDRILATAAATNELVLVDANSLTEVGRVATGRAPDGVAWDAADGVVAVSDQGDGAISLLPDGGMGTRVQIALGTETGNVTYDAARSRFWITVVRSGAVDQLVSVDPRANAILERVDLPGCAGAHGLRLHPDGRSAYVACESNATILRVDLAPTHAIVSAPVGASPDVLAIDEARGLLYVAAESGDLTVFDLARAGLVDLDDEHPDDTAHTIAVDPATHRVFLPLERGAAGTPVLRIMRPGDA